MTLSQALEEKREFQRLLESRGWLRLRGVVQEQIDSLQREVLFNPLKCLDEALQQEFRKGQLVGMLSLEATVETALESLEMDINSLREEEDGTAV